MTTQYVQVSRPKPGIALVSLHRPDRLNTLNQPLIRQLSEALRAVGDDRDCRVVVLTGAGRAFCAGLDLRGYEEDADPADRHPLHFLAMQREIVAVMEQIHRLPQPVIAAVNGAAAGGGLALACVADIRIASDDAVFAVSFIRAGFSGCDMGVSWLLPRIVGAGHAHELMLTGRKAGAAEAARIGLVTDVVPGPDLLEAAMAEAQEIMLNPPASVELTKQGMWLSLEAGSLTAAIEFENRQQVITAMTEDAREATAAFLEKRPPAYRYR